MDRRCAPSTKLSVIHTTEMKIITKALKISTPIGLLVGVAMCIVAWQHNPQCEFHCNGHIDWLAFFMLWVSWLVAIGVLGGLVFSLFFYIRNLLIGNQNV